jgi:hypothetical protein
LCYLFGLVLSEISFERDEDLDCFQAPLFALAEVTKYKIFSGGRLSELTFEDIRNEVARNGLTRVKPD